MLFDFIKQCSTDFIHFMGETNTADDECDGITSQIIITFEMNEKRRHLKFILEEKICNNKKKTYTFYNK